MLGDWQNAIAPFPEGAQNGHRGWDILQVDIWIYCCAEQCLHTITASSKGTQVTDIVGVLSRDRYELKWDRLRSLSQEAERFT